jgi:CRP-like cAMP-binding protein
VGDAKKLESYDAILRSCELFGDIAPEQLYVLLDCLGATKRRFRKGEFILRAGDAAEAVGIVLVGSAHVIQEDYWGNRTIITRIEPGGLFAEAFCCAGIEQLPVSVVSLEETEVLFVDFNRIISVCSSACGFHNSLIKNMLQILARHNVTLTRKLEDVTQRTTREKLLSYFSRQALAAGSERFEIPFNRQELADYLSVDRSALSNELSKMQTEGLLRFRKNEFELL